MLRDRQKDAGPKRIGRSTSCGKYSNSVFCLTLTFPTLAQAADRGQDKSAFERQAIQKAKQRRPETLGFPACSLCFTCGGAWPNFSGAFDAVTNSQTTEHDIAC